MLRVGKIYRINDRIMGIPVYERVHYNYPDPNDDYYVAMYDNRFIDWYDPSERGWGYRYNRDDLRGGDIILVLEINTKVLHAWAGVIRPEHVAVKFLKEDIVGWLYQPLDSVAFEELPYNLAAK